jgi:predicted Zn-dependent protease
MKYTPRQPKTNVNVTPTSPLKDLLVMSGGLVAILLGVYLLLGLAVDIIVPRVSVDLEMKLGTVFTRAFKSAETESRHQGWVQDLTDRIQSQCANLPYDFQVHVEPSDDVNALAFPGGHIVVLQGLLDRVESENELAFVLSHEMGHYAHRDHLRGLGRSIVFMVMATALFGSDNSVSSFLANTLGLVELSYSRQQETEADEFGLEALDCLYGHVGGATDFFSKIPEKQDPGPWSRFFTTHPASARRITHINDHARQKNYDSGTIRALPGFWRDQK